MADNLLNLEEKITCGKIKSKAKTLLTGKINYNLILNKVTPICLKLNLNIVKKMKII